MEGSLIGWVANHRRHHVFSDRPGDPHSPHEYDGNGFAGPLRGFFHAHIGWLFKVNATSAERFAPDLVRDNDVAIISRLFPLFAVFSLAAPFFLGWAWSGTIGGALTALLWAGAARMMLLHHVTWSVNSICHMFGNAARDRQGPQHQLRAARRRVDGRGVAQLPSRAPALGAPRRTSPPGRSVGRDHPPLRTRGLGDRRALADDRAGRGLPNLTTRPRARACQLDADLRTCAHNRCASDSQGERMATDVAGPGGAVESKGLKTGALGLASTIVIGVASTAPAYSIAATLGFVTFYVGLKAPAVMWIAFLPMACIAAAFFYLNRADPDCGTNFSWVTRAMGPRTGWLGGWSSMMADLIVMPSLAFIAAKYTFLLFGWDNLANNTLALLILGVVFIMGMTWICVVGIELSARTQLGLLAHRARGARAVQRGRADQGAHPHARLRLPVVVVVDTDRLRRRQQPQQRAADRGLHLLGLGHRVERERGEREREHDARATRA